MNQRHTDPETKIRQLEYEIEELKDRLYQTEKLLDEVYKSKTWRLGQLYGRIIGVESVFKRRLSGFMRKFSLSTEAHGPHADFADGIKVTNEHYAKVEDFTARCETATGVFIIVAETAIADRLSNRTDQLSHRAVKLAKEFDAMGYCSLFIVTEREGDLRDGRIEYVNKNILQMHMSVFHKIYRHIFLKLNHQDKQRILLLEILHPALVEILGYANASGWITAYDFLDNWEEFFKQGWHSWYDRRVEEFILHNVDYRITVSPFLREKFHEYEPIHIVHNGCSPDIASDYVKELKRGRITIGYIGNLQEFRFDWEFLVNIANKEKEWIFYLVGLLPDGISLPDNIIHLPPVKPKFLCAYAGNWDVAMIPFKINPLTLSCDNLKIYEYLLFRLPVVARGVGAHAGNYPFVYLAETEEAFIQYIESAALTKIDEPRISSFLQQSDWTSRARELLNVVQSGQQNYKELLYESPLHP